jgi:hypothetical protein
MAPWSFVELCMAIAIVATVMNGRTVSRNISNLLHQSQKKNRNVLRCACLCFFFMCWAPRETTYVYYCIALTLNSIYALYLNLTTV